MLNWRRIIQTRRVLYLHRRSDSDHCALPPKPCKPCDPTPPGKSRVYKLLTFLVCFPVIGVLLFANIVAMGQEKERPPFIPYTHMRIRTKRFPWGEGNKSLFHNPHYNPLPEGYEDEQ